MKFFKLTINKQNYFFYKKNSESIIDLIESLARKSYESQNSSIKVDGKEVNLLLISKILKKRSKAPILHVNLNEAKDKIADYIALDKSKLKIVEITELPESHKYLTILHDYFKERSGQICAFKNFRADDGGGIGLNNDQMSLQLIDLMDNKKIKMYYKFDETIQPKNPDYLNEWTQDLTQLGNLIPDHIDRIDAIKNIYVGFEYNE